MKNIIKFTALLLFFLLINNNEIFSQKIAFVSTDQIRESFPDAKAADIRLQTILDEWKREQKELDQLIEAKTFEIEKNRLIWTENEKIQSNNELQDLKNQRMQFAKVKYAVSGEYDKIVNALITPIEEKIYAAIQKVAAENKVDIVWDKSIQPLTYTNFKFDLTIKVLKELGVNTSELEAELNKKIELDPRNSPENQSKETPTSRTRKRRTSPKDTEKNEIDKKENQEPSFDKNKLNDRQIEREQIKIERK